MGEPCKNQRHPRTMITALRWLASSATTEQANSQFAICRVPCLRLRKNTERPVTVTRRTNTIVGCDPRRMANDKVMDALGYQASQPAPLIGTNCRAANRAEYRRDLTQIHAPQILRVPANLDHVSRT